MYVFRNISGVCYIWDCGWRFCRRRFLRIWREYRVVRLVGLGVVGVARGVEIKESILCEIL